MPRRHCITDSYTSPATKLAHASVSNLNLIGAYCHPSRAKKTPTNRQKRDFNKFLRLGLLYSPFFPGLGRTEFGMRVHAHGIRPFHVRCHRAVWLCVKECIEFKTALPVWFAWSQLVTCRTTATPSTLVTGSQAYNVQTVHVLSLIHI